MAYVLQFPTFTEYDYVTSMCDRGGVIRQNQVFTWLTYGKLAESPLAVPMYQTVTVEPSSVNRYLEQVTVSPIPSISYTVKLAAAATMTITNPAISKAVSTNTAYVTAAVVDGTLTITGVATGTATITVSDDNDNLMYTIVVTVA